MISFKEINIGNLIKLRVEECQIETDRICKFFSCTEKEILEMYQKDDLGAGDLLKWSKLLGYDFFRIYSQHLIFYSPPSGFNFSIPVKDKSALPHFRKNIYTREIIYFILEKINNGDKTKEQVIREYKIPKTTLYKWISKYKS
ncbi:transposase [Chryseobacterium ginsenosidimutans]|uniref:transposase n=1 Tax=Chryseobacterium ginsenosidimutans TaxID=687846 RepID=UPI0031CFEB7F